MTRSIRPLTFLLVAATIAAVWSGAARAQDMRLRKKLIATGWDHADTKRLLENLTEMEKRPFDGVVIVVVGKNDQGKAVPMVRAHQGDKWQRPWFQQPIQDLKACKFRQFTDNFLSFGANPGSVDWFDDEGWRNIVEHWRIAAWVAKQSGVKGLLFDPEPYSQPYAQFHYAAQAQRDKHSFDEYYAKARQRGREIMQAVVEEYPTITVFCYFMNSVNATAVGNRDPRRALVGSGYGLYPAMIDGWLDVAPPTVKLVDGCESAYHYNSVSDYLEAGLLMKGACQELVSPENRAKYRAQVGASFGMYLDAYWNPKGPYFIDGLGGPRVDRLRANTATALRVADEYVWVYGEKFRWWPTPNGGVRKESWPEALPGSEDALRYARDPADYARTAIAQLKQAGVPAGTPANLTRNGDFSAEKITFDGQEIRWKEGANPAGWSSWQMREAEGKFAWDRAVGAAAKGAARMAGMSNGCFIQSYPVKPGERYVVRAVRKLQGRGDASIRVRWQTDKNAWIAEAQDRMVFCDGPAGEWAELFGVAQVPEGVGRLVLLLGVHGQQSADDVAWYDDVELYKLP